MHCPELNLYLNWSAIFISVFVDSIHPGLFLAFSLFMSKRLLEFVLM